MKAQPKSKTAHQGEREEDDKEESLDMKPICPVFKFKAVTLTTQVKINEICLIIEIGTGAVVTIISVTTYKEYGVVSSTF